jgi:hypothetical protein
VAQLLSNRALCRAPFIATGCAALLAALYGLMRLPETRLWKEAEQQTELEQQQQIQQEQRQQQQHSATSTDQLSSAPASATEQAAVAAPAEKCGFCLAFLPFVRYVFKYIPARYLCP